MPAKYPEEFETTSYASRFTVIQKSRSRKSRRTSASMSALSISGYGKPASKTAKSPV